MHNKHNRSNMCGTAIGQRMAAAAKHMYVCIVLLRPLLNAYYCICGTNDPHNSHCKH